MSTFSVFVEGAAEEGDAALERLATAMAARYGLPAAELIARMKRGRFRVKANIDRATADTYVKDLTTIGARAIAEEGRMQSQPSIQVSNVAVEPAPRPSAPAFTSGLSAAYAPTDAKMDLGALGGEHQTFSLSSIDGSSATPAAPIVEARFTPPPTPGPSKSQSKPKPPPPSNEPLDLFAPPGGDDDDVPLQVDLAPDEVDRSRKTSIPPLTMPAEASATPAMRRSSPSMAPTNVGATAAAAPAQKNLLANPRVRLVAGVLLAIVIGFIPAHLVGAMRQKSAFQTIDDRVNATQRAASTETELSALDDYRATELANKQSSHRNIALVSMLIWAVVGAGVGYAWFKKMPIDRDA